MWQVAHKLARARRTFYLAVAEGLGYQTGMSATHASLVLAVLLNSLGASTAIVGSISAIRFAGWSLPQLFVANALETRQLRMPIYRWNNGVRFPLYFIMAAVVGFWGKSHPSWTIAAFLVLYAASRVTAGIAAAARSDILGKVLEPGQTSEFFAARALVGSVGGFLAGFLVSAMLGDRGPNYPWNFSALLALSGVIFGFAWAAFIRIPEPPSETLRANHSLARQLRVSRDLLRHDGNYTTYLCVRICLAFVEIATPFYALYAIDALGIKTSLVGTYLSMMTFAAFVANPFWGRLGLRRGSHVVLRISCSLGIVAPLLAIGLPLIGTATGQAHTPLFAYIYGLVFLVNGITSTGSSVSFQAYLLDMAPAESRPTYIGLTNTVRGTMDFLTIAAGQAVDVWGYSRVFLAAAALIAIGALLSFRLKASQGTSARSALGA